MYSYVFIYKYVVCPDITIYLTHIYIYINIFDTYSYMNKSPVICVYIHIFVMVWVGACV